METSTIESQKLPSQWTSITSHASVPSSSSIFVSTAPLKYWPSVGYVSSTSITTVHSVKDFPSTPITPAKTWPTINYVSSTFTATGHTVSHLSSTPITTGSFTNTSFSVTHSALSSSVNSSVITGFNATGIRLS